MSSIRSLALLALSTGFASLSAAQASGSGSTTRYWDCCKGSCSWPGKADVSSPVQMCGINDTPLSDPNEKSASDGGNGYMCSDQSPWAVNETMSYGFAAVNIPGGSEASWCCACYELTFTSEKVAGKKMIVQATNTGADLAGGQFDLAMPGGGVGIYNACTKQWGAPAQGWGEQYGGIATDECDTFPSALQPGCSWRFDWFGNSDNPDVDWKQVTCPKALTDKTGCIRQGETPTGGDEGSDEPSTPKPKPTTAAPPASSSPAAASSYAAPASSSAAAESSSVAAASSYGASSASSAAAVSSSADYSSTKEAPTGYGSMSAPASSASYAAPEESCEVEYVYENEL
ncbi:uncharacterized protein LTR77_004259 [Saxophila tyrrhenica]|uniref:Cellulase n=1 Tax=Saxophila tyrrhenica TaxID=1690608 RepID=A0AAV9PFE2_9PEZI|nr:hypothetical protein LTR77_004259 [Saxophila tyrrhenica]